MAYDGDKVLEFRIFVLNNQNTNAVTNQRSIMLMVLKVLYCFYLFDIGLLSSKTYMICAHFVHKKKKPPTKLIVSG